MTPKKPTRIDNALLEAEISILKNDIEHVKDTGDRIEKAMEKLVSRTEFEPVRNIVYGAVGIILVAVLGALVMLVVNSQNQAAEVPVQRTLIETPMLVPDLVFVPEALVPLLLQPLDLLEGLVK